MATDNINQRISGLTAAADLSARKHSFVAVSGAKQVNLPSAGARADAVLYNDPASGAAADLVVSGVAIVIAAGTISAGAYVTGDANGQAVAATTGDIQNGIALEAGAAGQYISVLLGYYGAA